MEQTRQKDIQLALEKTQILSKELTLLKRIDRKTNDIKENLVVIHHHISDVADKL